MCFGAIPLSKGAFIELLTQLELESKEENQANPRSP